MSAVLQTSPDIAIENLSRRHADEVPHDRVLAEELCQGGRELVDADGARLGVRRDDDRAGAAAFDCARRAPAESLECVVE